jgi:hypothetical protein
MVRLGICSKCIFDTFMLRLFHAYSGQDYAPRCTVSTLALKQFVFPRLRWNSQRQAVRRISLARCGVEKKAIFINKKPPFLAARFQPRPN